MGRRGIVRVEVGDGLSLWARATGDGAGGGSVIVPGAAIDADLCPLAEDRPVVFYDTRARGRSDAVHSQHRVGFWADVADAERIRRSFSLERAAWMGWSYLAGVVVRHALMAPARVSRLVLVTPIGPASSLGGRWVMDAPPGGLAHLDQLRAAGVDREDPERFCRAWREVYLPLQVADPTCLEHVASDPCRCANEWPGRVTETLANVFIDLGIYDWRDELGTLDVPVLVVQGDDDSDHAAARGWVDALPDARMLLLGGVRRLPWLEDPDTFFGAVGEFLAGRWPAGCER
jgi:proline iminopeptidase